MTQGEEHKYGLASETLTQRVNLDSRRLSELQENLHEPHSCAHF